MFMEKMHQASNSGFAKVIFGFISVSFFVTGMYGYLGINSDNYAAKVNGEEISQQQFQSKYNDEYQRAGQLLGAKFSQVANTPEFVQGIKNQVLNNLVDQQLLSQYLAELKLMVTDERIKQEIVRTPMFQKNGKFDNELYQRVLRDNNMSTDMYAQYLREMLLLEQLQGGLADSAFLTPANQQQFSELFFQQRKIRFANLPLANVLNQQTVSEQEIQDYYNANLAAFIQPELLKVQYLDLTKTAVEKSINLDEKAILQYYQDNKAQFGNKAQVHLAHIQFANEKDALDAYQALQNGADFATLAKEKSDDKFSGQNGGDLGWMNADDLPKDFEDTALLLEEGKFSTPIQVDGNYHIVQVKARKAAQILPLEQVRDQVIAQARQELLNNQFYAVEKRVAEKAFEDQSSLNAAAAEAGVAVKETGYFSRDEIPAELNFPTVAHAMFDGEISQGNMNSEPMNVADQHSIVVRVLEHKAQSQKTLDESKAEIADLLKRQKAQAVLLAQAEEMIKPLNAGSETKLPDAIKFDKQQTWIYAQNTDPALNNVVFAMKLNEGKTAYQVAQANNGDVVIIALDAIENPPLDAQTQQQFNARIAQTQQSDLIANLLNALRAKAKIEVNENFLKQQSEF